MLKVKTKNGAQLTLNFQILPLLSGGGREICRGGTAGSVGPEEAAPFLADVGLEDAQIRKGALLPETLVSASVEQQEGQVFGEKQQSGWSHI